MQANTEFEEGEAFCYKDDDDHIDLDSLSYIDERIQHVLGHFQKDFEGGICAERLGAKFGDYGSFLPTYECSPPFRSCPKTTQKHYSSPKPPSNLHMVAAFHHSKASSNMPSSMRLRTASHNAHPFHNLRVPSIDNSAKKNTRISSNEEMEKCTLKAHSENKSGSLTDQRTLKLRIKVKSDILAKKNAAIYSGIGLDNSPSSSMGNSLEESEDMPPVSQETPEESPTSMVQVMTSFAIPGGVLISPLHDRPLYLIRKDKVLVDSRHVSSLNGHEEHYSMSTDESDSLVGDRHMSKKRKVTSVDQSEKQHMDVNCSENDMALHMKKRFGNRTPDRKDFLSNDLKCTPLSSSICDVGETTEVQCKAFEVSKGVNKDGVECRMVLSEAAKEDSLESISGQDFNKIQKQNTGNSFVKIVMDHKPETTQNNNSTDPKNNIRCNVFAISKKVKRDAVKCKVDQDTQKCETNQKGKVKSESKNKSKGERNPGKVMTAAEKDSVGTSYHTVVTDGKSAGFGIISGQSKMNKIKSLKDNKVRQRGTDSLNGKNSEWKVDAIDETDGPPLSKVTINANLDNVEAKSAYKVKVKEKLSDNKVVNQLLAESCVKDAPGAFAIAENKPTSEVVPPSAAAAPQLIEEDWVCCDSCQKWRLLPMGLKPEQLPEKWLCSMLYWLPGMNRCNISEEETTKALYALYQMPITEGQNNMQSNATRPETRVRSVDALQLGLNYKKSSSDGMFDQQGKKKLGIKGKAKTGINNNIHQFSNTEKNNALDSVKNRSLINMNQKRADSNCVKKSSSKHLSKLKNLIEEKNTRKEKEKQMNGGDRNSVKLKLKMEANEYRSETSKKSKTEDVCHADKQLNSDMEFEKKDLNSRNGFSRKSSGKDTRKYDDYCLPDNLQDKLVVPVKKRDQAQFSSDDGSLDATNCTKNSLIKKRKLRDWLSNERHNNALSIEGDKQCGEEGEVSGFMKEKKYIVLNTKAKSVTEGDDELSGESGMKQGFLSDSRDQMTVGTEVKSVDKAWQPRKHQKNVTSYQALDSLGKDLGSGQISLAATSSSSKVSGSHKARTNLEDVRGSPVESVTSTPLRTSNLDRRSLATGHISEKNGARKGGLLSMSSKKSLDNREGKLSLKLKDKRVSYSLYPTQHGHCGNGLHHEEKVSKINQENALSWQKSGKITSLRVKEKGRSSGPEVNRDKVKVSASDNGFSKNGESYESAGDASHHVSGTETRNEIKKGSPKFNLREKNSRHLSKETGKQTELKQKDSANSVLKADAPCSTNRKIISQQNLSQNFKEENKANPVYTGSRDGKTKVFSSSEGEAKRETLYVGSRIAPGSQKGDMSNGHPAHASGNGDVTKLVRNSVDISCNVGVNCISGSYAPDGQLSESSPSTTYSGQTAFSILEEAKKLKDSADHYKILCP
ncbi:uncharacterized protein LOC113847373 isoform X2 [Abrus precatorius]|uniref:Uncharacterized protein LOC113847373 isoform X2 n=1 Tax=Abrus precatorius TaxID=3816 RepID=A0A8B8JLC9_ABRPR|nr:uncharacterized protein LOC113847373 isoform X2 [Abrus precatorius]